MKLALKIVENQRIKDTNIENKVSSSDVDGEWAYKKKGGIASQKW